MSYSESPYSNSEFNSPLHPLHPEKSSVHFNYPTLETYPRQSSAHFNYSNGTAVKDLRNANTSLEISNNIEKYFNDASSVLSQLFPKCSYKNRDTFKVKIAKLIQQEMSNYDLYNATNINADLEILNNIEEYLHDAKIVVSKTFDKYTWNCMDLLIINTAKLIQLEKFNIKKQMSKIP